MKNLIKKNYKFIITLVLIVLCFGIKFPYYIDAPGGISDVSEKIEIDGYDSNGSFNLAYVKEYNATIPTLLLSLFNKDWKVLKQEEVLLDNEDNSSYLLRDKIFMDESISNAIFVAYHYANKEIKIISNNFYVTYISDYSNTDLKVGDIITKVNGEKIESKEEILDTINESNINDKIYLTVTNKGKEYKRYAYVVNEDNNKKIGVLINTVFEYSTNPKITIKTDKNESGSSGGLITALAIYNSLVEEDITHGLTIVGTGTIDLDGKVGSIGGVEYKLKSAVKSKADLFIVPNDENYDEAIKIKNKNNYNIKIIGVDTFEDAIDYLQELK